MGTQALEERRKKTTMRKVERKHAGKIVQFTERQHRQLAEVLAGFESTRVVCRFYDVPLIEELYPERLGWTWRRLTGRALKLHGVKCAATIRQTRLDERALGNSDLHIKLDKDIWDESDEEQREAIIDHELSHFVPRLEKKTGLVKRDNFDRPLFAAVNHDWQVGWFFSVVRRHGLKSIECRQLQDFLVSDNYRDCFKSTKVK